MGSGELKTSFFIRFLTRHYVAVMIISMTTCIVLSVIAFMVPMKLSSTGNFYPRGNRHAEEYDGFKALEDRDVNCMTVPERPRQTGKKWDLMMIYASSGSTVWTPERVSWIRDVEQMIAGVSGYPSHCWMSNKTQNCQKPYSPIEVLLDGVDLSNSSQIEQALVDANNDSEIPLSLGFFFGKDASKDGNYQTKYTRTLFSWGVPLAGYRNEYDSPEDQEEDTKDWVLDKYVDLLEIEKLSENGLDVYHIGDFITEYEINQMVARDMMLFLGSILSVFIIMCIQTMSPLLSFLGLVHILMSLTVSLFFFLVVFGFEVFTAMNLYGLFVVLGVGADDVFVMLDAWKQSFAVSESGLPVDCNIAVRMQWTWSRAAKAMLVTSFTTMVAFLGLAFNPIPSFQVLGIYTGTAIAVNYILVITWFPACIMMWNSLGFHRRCCCFWKFEIISALRRKKKMEAEKQPAPSQKDSQKDVEMAVVVRATDRDPNDVVISTGKRYDETKTKSITAPVCLRKCLRHEVKYKELEDTHELNFVERFYHKRYSPFAAKWRHFIFLFCMIVVVVFLVFALSLRRPNAPGDEFRDDYPLGIALDIYSTEFRQNSQWGTTKVYFVFGVEGIDRSGIDMNDEELGKVVFMNDHTKFDLMDIRSRKFLLERVCDVDWVASQPMTASIIRRNDDGQAEVNCFLQVMDEWLLKREGISVGNESLSQQEFLQHLDTFVKSHDDYINSVGLVYDSNMSPKDVQFAVVSVNSTLSLSPTVDEMDDALDGFDDFFDFLEGEAQQRHAPMEGYHTCQEWVWLDVVKILMKTVVFSVVTSLILAFFVMCITTGNIITSFFATMSISCVLLVIMGIIPMNGWSLGIVESISLSIIVGLSVDYVVHFANAYEECKEESRFLRVQAALTELGISVLGGCATTVSSTFFLFFAVLNYLSRFGFIVVVATLSSFFFANTFFICLLLCTGPSHRTGNILHMLRKFKNWYFRNPRTSPASDDRN